MNKTLFNHDLNVPKFFLSLRSMEIPIRQTQRKGYAIEGEKDKVKDKVKDEDKGKSHPAKARALSLTMRRGCNDDISGYSFGQK